jgi:Fic/DOC family
MDNLISFIIESNKIEGILNGPSNEEINAYKEFLKLDTITIKDISKFVTVITNGYGKLRNKKGMNVRVGNHFPIPGGKRVKDELTNIIVDVNTYFSAPMTAQHKESNKNDWHSYQIHLEYENLHAYLDGNGRSGRLIWAWMMKRENKDPFQLGFLHTFYYQTLENQR